MGFLDIYNLTLICRLGEFEHMFVDRKGLEFSKLLLRALSWKEAE